MKTMTAKQEAEWIAGKFITVMLGRTRGASMIASTAIIAMQLKQWPEPDRLEMLIRVIKDLRDSVLKQAV
jgi:hypothetical protein